jgi:UDP-glucose 4-epimerase
VKIVVTGGTGNVGRAAVSRLVRNGHQVTVIGRRSDAQTPGAIYRQCDITDFDSLRRQVSGMEGIVHLAAIPYPGGAPGHQLFHINCAGTYNLYRAAADEGIHKIASASSINALGFNYGIEPFPIRYFPVDEMHPTHTTDSYSFSKQIVEQIADYFWRREGISSVNLRLPAVYECTPDRVARIKADLAQLRQDLEMLMGLDKEERRHRVSRAIQAFDAQRPQRSTPMRLEEMRSYWRAQRQDTDLRLVLGGFGRSNFWTSIDARDSAQALEKGLCADYEGSHPIFVNDSQNATGIESEILAGIFFPDVTMRKRVLNATDSLVSIDKARALLDFEPEHSIADW